MNIFQILGTIAVNNSDANKAIDETANKAKSASSVIGDKLTNAGNKLTGLGKKLAPVSAIMSGALVATTKSASDFQNGMAKMSTLFDTSKNSVSKLSKEFLNLSNKTGVSAAELSEAGYQALSAGVDVKNSSKFVETAAKLSKTGFTSTSTAVDVLTTAINAYKLKSTDAESIANKLVRTQNLGKTTVDELASSMGKIIPTASSMNVNINNLAAGYVQLTKQGISTRYATTYMNSMLNELGDSGTTVGEILKSKTGKSFQDLMKDGNSLGDVLGILQKEADDSGTNFNELWGSSEAGKGAIALLNQGVGEFNKTVKTMESNTDDMSVALEKLNTPSAKAKKALNMLKNTGIELGTVVLDTLDPALTKIVSGVSKFTSWFSKLNKGTKTIIVSVMALLAAASPALILMGKVANALSLLTSSTGGLSRVLGAVTSPIGLVVIAITALIAIFAVLYNTNEGFRKQVDQAWKAIKTTIGSVITAIQGLISAFVSLAKSIWQKWGNDIVNIAKKVFNLIFVTINTALKLIRNIIKTITALIKGDWRGVWEGIKSIISTVWTGIQNIIKAALVVIESFIKLKINIIKTAFNTGFTAIKNLITTILNAIKTIFITVLNAIKTVVSTAITSVKNTISSAMAGIKTAVSTEIGKIKSVFSDKFESIKSTVSDKMNSIKDSITSKIASAKTAATNAIGGIKDAFEDKLKSAKSTVDGWLGKIKSAFNFSWSLPSLKLPHISVSGGTAPYGIGGKGSLPKFNISWYKKAVENPVLFSKPTVFDINPYGGTAKGAGEAGDELMYGKENLMRDIQEVVSQENSNESVYILLNKIYSWMRNGGLYRLIVDVLTNAVSFEFENREVARVVERYAK